MNPAATMTYMMYLTLLEMARNFSYFANDGVLSTIFLPGLTLYAGKPQNKRGRGELDKLRFVISSVEPMHFGIKA